MQQKRGWITISEINIMNRGIVFTNICESCSVVIGALVVFDKYIEDIQKFIIFLFA